MTASKVGKAVDAVGAAVALLARWEADAAAKAAELADLEGRAGLEALDGTESAADDLARQMSYLRSALDVAGRAIVAAGERLADARREVLRVRAGELQAEAAKLQAEAASRQRKTDRLLAELQEWEGGARYVSWEPGPRNPGDSVSYKIPLTQALRNRAAGLEQQAEALAAQAESVPAADLAVVLQQRIPEMAAA